MNTTIIKERKQRKSILDDYVDEIKYYRKIGLNITAISILLNEKIPGRLTLRNYNHYINKKL